MTVTIVKKGFSLIELLIAMAIFSISILGMGTLIFHSVKLIKTNKLKGAAIHKAEELINYLTSLPYNNPSLEFKNYTCCTNGKWCNPDSGGENCCSNDIKDFLENTDFCGSFTTIKYSVIPVNCTDIKKIRVIIESKSDNFTLTLEQLKGNWQ